MAMIKGGNKLMGKKLFVSTSKGNKNIPIEIVKPVFIDPEKQKADIMTKIISIDGVEITQKNFQQILIARRWKRNI